MKTHTRYDEMRRDPMHTDARRPTFDWPLTSSETADAALIVLLLLVWAGIVYFLRG